MVGGCQPFSAFDPPQCNFVARGDAGAESAATFGHVDRIEDFRLKLIKTTLNLDDGAGPADAVPIAELVSAWELCSKCTGVETKAERSVRSFDVNAAQSWSASSSRT